MALDEVIREQAVAWAVRTGEPAFEDWDAFTAWLEEDPAHARAYDEVLAAVADAAEALPPLPPAQNDDEPSFPTRRRRWLGGAIAASVAVVVALGVWQARPATYAIETAPGEVRVVELDGGDRIALAGASRIVLDRRNPRTASLEQGQALFTLDHDPDAPFTLSVGEDTLVDVGTIFDVRHTPEGMALAVSEGAVVFNPARQNVRVSPGQRLTSATGSDQYRLSAVPAGEVGEWREGRLTFQDTRLEDVALDLSRLTGVEFTVAAPSADRRVSGSLVIDPVRRDPRALSALLGVAVRHNGEAWEIGAQ
jgi:transmembrane sensor